MRKAVLLAITVASAAMLASLLPATTQGVEAAAAAAEPPNIIVILTDDQRVGTMQTLPAVRRQIRDKGADYVGVVPTSVCCPARASLLTGNYAHTTRVYSNNLDLGGWPAFNQSGSERQTIATALQDAGYETAFIGKYLNYWNQSREGFVPPGWDSFEAIYRAEGQGAGAYYNYELRGTKDTVAYGDSTSDYSTKVIHERTLDYLENAPNNSPYLAFISVVAPHEPATTLPRDKGSYIPAKRYDAPSVNELDMSDKPDFLQTLEPVKGSRIDRMQIGTGESLRPVNRLVDDVLETVDMSNTLVIFTSDNGKMWGDHRLQGKYWPYRFSTEVPMFMRWDGVIERGASGMVANIDIAPTILDAAGVPNALSMEGHSVLDGTRARVLLEGVQRGPWPGYCGVRSKKYMFVQYADGQRELYDYEVDPYELKNKAHARAYRDTADRMLRRTQNLCTPTPPGFNWNP